MDAKIIKLGSLYFDRKLVDVGATYNDKPLSIGDTVPGKEIQWVKDGNRLIADRCVCDKISWNQLDQMGLVKGAPVLIDGRMYLCRCPRTEPAFSEWYSLLDEYGNANVLWHWSHMYFWSKDESKPSGSIANLYAARGYYTADHRDWFFKGTQLEGLGFRPVLEPMPASLEVSDALVGHKVKMYGPNGGFLTGTLKSLDDYDLTLDCVPPLPAGCGWMGLDRGMVVVKRNAVVWMQKA